MYDLFVNHFRAYLDGRDPPQQLVSLDGEGGTGKTYLIACITSTMAEMALGAGVPNPLVKCAPTGVSANLINGKTLHSQFNIPISAKNGQIPPLSASARQQVQAIFRHARYVIIDEKSMVSLELLAWIHQRCGEALPQHASLPFAGLNIILAGDFWQLPPVGRNALFNLSEKRTLVDDTGAKLYRMHFNKTVELDTVMRQVGDSQKLFREALSRLRRGTSTQEDWVLFMSRCRVQLTTAEKGAFIATLRLCAERSDVAMINY
jgi:ATP-dependent DNA helicase PIF1